MSIVIQNASATGASSPRSVAAIPKKTNWYPYILIAPTFLTLIIVSLVPFIYAVYLSLHEARYGVVKNFVWFDNYIQLLTDPTFWNAMYVSGLFVLIAVPVQFVLGLGGALILNRGVVGRSLIVPLLFIPAMMAPVVVGLLWKIMLAGSWGVLSYNVIERFNIVTDASIFGSPHYALYALIFIDIWQWTPFMMLAFFAGLQALPSGPYRAASVDGAGPFRTFFKLTLPLLAPLLFIISLLRIIDAFKVFDTIFILTRGGPGTSTEALSILAYKMTFDFWDIGHASAMAVVVWIIFFIFCNIFYQVAKKKLNAF